MSSKQDIIDACSKLIGQTFEFRLDADLASTFTIYDYNCTYLKYQDPTQFENDLWYCVAGISWGQGYNTALYYNGKHRLIAVHDMLTTSSVIQREYIIQT